MKLEWFNINGHMVIQAKDFLAFWLEGGSNHA